MSGSVGRALRNKSLTSSLELSPGITTTTDGRDSQDYSRTAGHGVAGLRAAAAPPAGSEQGRRGGAEEPAHCVQVRRGEERRGERG